MSEKLKALHHLQDEEWPCLKIMRKVRIIILIMASCAFFVFCFFSYLNYQVNFNTYLETKKIADFVGTLEAVDVPIEEENGMEDVTCCAP